MRPARTISIVLGIAAAFVLGVQADDKPPTHKEKGDLFLEHLEEIGTPQATLAGLREEWARLQEEDPTADFITEGLIQLEEPFRLAIHQFQQDYTEKASAAFAKIRDESKDPYLLAAATYFEARCHVKNEAYDKAGPLLNQVVGEHGRFTQLEPEAAFYLGLACANLLEREKAIEMLERFLEQYPDASERYRSVAMELRDDLKYRGENELLDLSDRMKLVERLLDKVESGEPTQNKQQEIVDILDKLIKKHEDDCPT